MFLYVTIDFILFCPRLDVAVLTWDAEVQPVMLHVIVGSRPSNFGMNVSLCI